MFSELQATLTQRTAQGLLRRRSVISTPQTPRIEVDGKPYLAFCSNDYLGLANHPQLIQALRDGAQQFGVGAGAAHLVNGHFSIHETLEQSLAEFVGKPDALLFSTGYMANLGVIQGLLGKGDAIFADKLNHASLNDAMQLSRAEVKRFRHNDLAQLEQLLTHSSAPRKLIIVDAVFSMDGDLAPIPELLALCEQYDAYLYLDDAHGFGVLGQQGRGVMSHWGVKSPRMIYMATLGKAAGVFGAFVAAEPVIIDTLINFAHTYVYTTAAPPALAHSLLTSLNLIQHMDAERQHLFALIQQLRAGLAHSPWQLMNSTTPIQPIHIGDAEQALWLSQALRRQGIWVAAIRPPTVPINTARLRITLSAQHTTEDVDCLLAALAAC